MDYDRDSLQIYLLCADKAYLKLRKAQKRQNWVPFQFGHGFLSWITGVEPYAPNIQYISLRNEGPARSFLVWFLLAI